jgi:hypothetical protein
MLTGLDIKNFRGFDSLALGPLKRVNLIVGQNNTGKTGLLEALALMLGEPPQHCHQFPTLFRSAGGTRTRIFGNGFFVIKTQRIRSR